ncbi:MAG: sulfite exporter TauE/SafE family protein [Chloroflexi bacterium]|nr:sulfite exporter TauE/SafE family protein [Chloroflexota bacterium]
MELLLITVIAFVSTYVQTVSGFGIALVAMPLLTSLLGLGAASPLVALLAFAGRVVILARYRGVFDLRAVLPLVIASLIGIQIGSRLLFFVPERALEMTLGVLLCVYVLYAWQERPLPEMRHTSWAFGAGFVSGVLAGAYNVGGPPVVIYANSRRWPRDVFRSNLQGFAMFNSVAVLATHWTNGHLTPALWELFLLALPAAGLALWLGFRSDDWLHQERFRRIVLLVLFFSGVQLFF